jgi:DNA gyrase subunit A
MSIRLPAKDVSIIGRNVQGVRLLRQEQDDKLAAIAQIAKEAEDDGEGKQEDLPLKK